MRYDEWQSSGARVRLLGREAFVRASGAGPALLFLHGYPTSSYDFSDVNRPLTVRHRTSVIGILKKAFGGKSLDDLSPFDVERFKRDREQQGAAPATINRAVVQLKHVYRMAVEWGWLTLDKAAPVRTVRMLKEPPGRVRYLSTEEEAKLFGALKVPMRLIIEACGLSGMRRAEAVLLKKDAVDLERRTLTLRKTKSNRVRTLPVNDALAVVLKTAIDASPSEYVFTQDRGKLKGQPYKLNTVSRAFARVAVRVGITDLHLHDMRHDFATKVRRGGAGIDVIKELLGHADISTSMRYAHVGAQLLRDAVAGLTAPIARPLPDGRKRRVPREPKKATQLL